MRVTKHTAYKDYSPADVAIAAAMGELARWTGTPAKILRQASGESRDKRVVRGRYKKASNP